MTTPAGTQKSNSALVFFLAGVTALLVFRILAIFFTQLDLGPDEAQYWRWSTYFDWGYFSKPPMIAWAIAWTTNLFGDSEWAVRIASPFFHTATAFLLFLSARRLAGEWAGVFAAFAYLLMPAVWLSATIMSTDVPLLSFWALGLYCLLRLRDGEGAWLSAIALGGAIGLGFLSKYAMIYFVLGLTLAVLIDQPTRKALITLKGALSGLIAALIFAPHMAWNARNDFKTVGHTADNANWGAQLLNPENAVKFVTDQMAVFGPATFALLLVLIVCVCLRKPGLPLRTEARLLLCFVLPPLIIILVQAVISRAHANWAATAYPAAAILLGVWAAEAKGWVRVLLLVGLGFNSLAGVICTAAVMSPPQVINDVGLANAVKRLRGWPDTVDMVNAELANDEYTSVIVDEREIWHGLDYYGRDGLIDVPILAWRRQEGAKSFSEEAPLTPENTAPALVLSYRASQREKMAADFETFERIGEREIDLGGGKFRRFVLFKAEGFSPVPRNEPSAGPAVTP